MRLAHAARDQLRDLGAEVEDQDLVVHGIRGGGAATKGGRGPGRGGSGDGQQQRHACSRAQKKTSARRCASRPAGGATPGTQQRRAITGAITAIRLFSDATAPSGLALLARVGGVGDQALHRGLGAAAQQVAMTITAYIIQPCVARPQQVGRRRRRPSPHRQRCG
jgi:hypothetical protein